MDASAFQAHRCGIRIGGTDTCNPPYGGREPYTSRCCRPSSAIQSWRAVFSSASSSWRDSVILVGNKTGSDELLFSCCSCGGSWFALCSSLCSGGAASG